MATGNFVKLFGKLEIPPLPETTTQMLCMCRDENLDMYELAKLVACDTGVSAKVLRTVNSSHSGLRFKVTSIQQATSLLGLRRMVSLLTAFAVSQHLPKNAPGFHRAAFWRRSVQRSVFAQLLAARISPGNEAEAFTGALLQDMALPILLGQWSKHYLPVVELAEQTGRPLQDVEDEELSWNHAQASAWMARNWTLPDVLVCCVGLHHAEISELKSMGLVDTPVAAVAVSSRLPNTESICAEEFDFTADEYEQLCLATDAACQELAATFNVPNPRPLAGAHAGAP